MTLAITYVIIHNNIVINGKKMEERKLTYKEYLIEKKKLEPTYAEEIVSYYKDSFTHCVLTTDILTKYRKQLLDLITEKAFLSEYGVLIKTPDQIAKEKEEEKNVFGFTLVKSPTDSIGLINFSIVQYEHDTLVDSYCEKYRTNLFDFFNFMNGEFSTRPDNYKKHKLFLSDNTKNQNDRTNLILKEIIYSYAYKSNKIYTGLFSWNDNFVICSLKSSLETNPVIPLVDMLIDKNKLTARVIKKSETTVLTTLSGSNILCISPSGWVIEAKDIVIC